MWIWIRVRLPWIARAVEALKVKSMLRHEQARREHRPELRAEADTDDAVAEALKEAERKGVRRE